MPPTAHTQSRIFTDPNQAAAAGRDLGARRVLKVRQGGQTLFVPVDGPPQAAVLAGMPTLSALPASVMAQINLSGIDLRQTARRGSFSGAPVLIGAMLGLYLDTKMPWGRGYGPVLGAVVGNAARDAAGVAAAGGGAGGAAAAFLGASLPIVPLAAFGWGVDLGGEPGSPGCTARRRIAGAGAAMLAASVLDSRLGG